MTFRLRLPMLRAALLAAAFAALPACPAAQAPDDVAAYAPPRLGPGEALAVFVFTPRQPTAATVAGGPRVGHPTAVVVTGLVGSAFGFRQVIPGLVREGWRVVVVDPLGMGHSAMPRDADYSFTAQAKRIAAVLDTLEVRDAVFVGHQLGAPAAYRVAIARPDMACAVVSIAGSALDEQGTPEMRRALSLGPLVHNPLGRMMVRRKVRESITKYSADDRWLTPAVLDRYMQPIAEDTRAAMRVLQGMVSAKEAFLLASELPKLRAPVHLLHGEAPGVGGVTPEEMRQLVTQLPAFTVDTLPGIGQFVNEEAPGVVVRAVTRHRHCAAGS